MPRSLKDYGQLVILRGGRTQVRLELERLIQEWQEWLETVKELPDSPDYNPQTTTIAIKDGFANIRLHERLREKTLVFFRNTFTGFEFVLDKWPSPPYEDNVYSRLIQRVPPWIDRLELLVDSLDYAVVKNAQADPINILNREFWDRIHPKVVEVARTRFESGQLADAVESSLKELNHTIKKTVDGKISPVPDGASLMTRVFSKDNPVIALDDLSTDSGKNIQQGYMSIFAGAMTGIRNPKAHANIDIDENRAIHLLFLTSLLFYKLDEGKLI
jgi:uncharacterized protein (TIGR02391 family)